MFQPEVKSDVQTLEESAELRDLQHTQYFVV